MTWPQSPRTQILATLLSSAWISGQALADAAGISRTAIWKHIHVLQEEGYPIQAASGLGYRLEFLPDHLGAEAVQAGLQTRALGRQIVFKSSLDSTQNLAKTLVEQGAEEGTVVLAESQSQGRGRRGRLWSSIAKGLAMSVILKPDLPPEKAPQFPILAGVALVRAISRLCPVQAGLKWPNDILIQGRKVVGILAELDAEMDRINAIYLGIGINVNARQEDIPEELRDIATSLALYSGESVHRVYLVRAILEELEAAYTTYLHHGFPPLREEWKKQNITLGRQVHVQCYGQDIHGFAEDMDEHGALLLRTQDGERMAITAGEVHLGLHPSPTP